MKAVILAGGRGTRISEESHLKPKPMVTIGDKPILWHIMKIYAAHGIRDFIICLGYRGYVIKEYFANYMLHETDAVTFDFDTKEVSYGGAGAEPWRVTLVETGLNTNTGGRLKRIRPWIEQDEAFCMTYGDGVADVDITALTKTHRESKALATVTTVTPPGRFGAVTTENDKVIEFSEKPAGDGTRINGGFFVLSPKVLDYVEGDETVWEKEPMQNLTANNELGAFSHDGFWQPMDTIREREMLEQMWRAGPAPWQIW